MVPSSNHHLH
uniref:Uncharacterized protein n=1 Tax=Arundo donax TaxID=35708 RepID=A0A0A9CRT5_ARUDO